MALRLEGERTKNHNKITNRGSAWTNDNGVPWTKECDWLNSSHLRSKRKKKGIKGGRENKKYIVNIYLILGKKTLPKNKNKERNHKEENW